MVRFVAAAVPAFGQAGCRAAAMAALSVVLSGCLAALQVDLTTAPAVAGALAALLSDSIAEPLRRLLLQALLPMTFSVLIGFPSSRFLQCRSLMHGCHG
jgi:hypothetical protein